MSNFFEKASFRMARWMLEDPRGARFARIFFEAAMFLFEPHKWGRKLRRTYFSLKRACGLHFDLNRIYWTVRKFIWRTFWLCWKLPKRIIFSVAGFLKYRVYWNMRKVAYRVSVRTFDFLKVRIYWGTRKALYHFFVFLKVQVYWKLRKAVYRAYAFLFRKEK